MFRFIFDIAIPPLAVHVLHTGTGLLLALQALLILPDIPLLYGADGMVDPDLLPGSGSTPSIGTIASYLHTWSGITASRLLVLLFAVYFLLTLLLAGRRLPWWGILLLATLHHAWFLGTPSFSYGADYLAASALFYCLCTCRPMRAWRTPALRLLQMHLCAIYFFGGLAKAMGPTWWNGEAVWKAVNQPYHLGRAPEFVALLGQFPLFWVVSGGAVVLLELCYPLFVWIPQTRPYWLGGVVAMHVGIGLFLGLFHFSALMILLNTVAFHLAYRNGTEQPKYPSHNDHSSGWQPVRKQQPASRGDTREGGTPY